MREKTGRPINPLIDSREFHDLERRSLAIANTESGVVRDFNRNGILPDDGLSTLATAKINWMVGGIDGGEIGITEALSGFVDEPATFDGGTV